VNRKQRILALVGVLALCSSRAHAADPFPPMTIPGIDHSFDLCVWRINKSFDGLLESAFWRQYECKNGATAVSRTKISFRVLSNDGVENCDEEVPDVPANWFLEAGGMTIHRRDGLAHFTGGVKLKDGAAGPVLFEGTMELMARIGTHQALGESCGEPEHIEGWIVARGVDALSGYTLRAQVAGQATLPGGLASVPPLNRITGVIIGK
jgi:hypothetical protein